MYDYCHCSPLFFAVLVREYLITCKMRSGRVTKFPWILLIMGGGLCVDVLRIAQSLPSVCRIYLPLILHCTPVSYGGRSTKWRSYLCWLKIDFFPGKSLQIFLSDLAQMIIAASNMRRLFHLYLLQSLVRAAMSKILPMKPAKYVIDEIVKFILLLATSLFFRFGPEHIPRTAVLSGKGIL